DLLQAENDWFEAGVAYLIASAGYDLAVYQMMAFTGDLQRLFSFDAAFDAPFDAAGAGAGGALTPAAQVDSSSEGGDNGA
ncbi:MAG: hypothetical protein AAF224_10820, partial [Pseudomonadota bacterium]